MCRIKENWKFILTISISIICIVILSTYTLNVQKDTLTQKELIGFISLIVVEAIIVVGSVLHIHNKHDIKHEQIFLYTVPIICSLFILTMPIFKSHDEHAHWHRVYEISTGNITTDVNESGGTISVLPKSAVCEDWKLMNYGKVISDIKNKIDNNDVTDDVYIVSASMYSPLQYSHMSIIVAVARIFIKYPLILAYIARIANMVICVILMFFSIKKIPFGKNILLSISYIPILIEGISSISGDGITFSVCLFFMAYLFNLVFNKDVKMITKKDKLVLVILSILIASCKIVYLPIVGLIILIPKEKMSGKKEKTITISIIIAIAIFISASWLIYSSRYLQSLANLSKLDVNTEERIIEIIKNPLSFVGRLLYNLEVNGSNYLKEMFGSGIGWCNFVSLNTIIPYSFMAMFLLVALSDDFKNIKINKFQKCIISLIVVGIVTLIFVALYFQWTNNNIKSIDGVQGRYFIPLLPMAGILIASIKKIKLNVVGLNIPKIIAYVGMILQFQFIMQVYISNI